MNESQLTIPDITELEKLALKLRRLALKIIFQAGSGHPGGSFSATDLMTALFFGGILNYDSNNPKDPKRDRFLLSKGHASAIYYSVLAKAGIFPSPTWIVIAKLIADVFYPDMLTLKLPESKLPQEVWGRG